MSRRRASNGCRPIHLQPTAPLAERVLLPGDPGRALLLAQALLAEPKMFNHNRGLWGYTGTAADGEPLTIQSTGMGGPSAAIVICELADLGARRLVRVGTCGALDRSLALGELLIATEAISADGTSRALGAAGRVAGDSQLLEALLAAGDGSAARGAGRLDGPLLRPPRDDGGGWRGRGRAGRRDGGGDPVRVAARRGLSRRVLIVTASAPARAARIEAEALKQRRAPPRRTGVRGLAQSPGARRG